MPMFVLAFALILGAIGAASLLPSGIVFLAATAALVGAGIFFADLQRDAGPRFLAPVTIGR